MGFNSRNTDESLFLVNKKNIVRLGNEVMISETNDFNTNLLYLYMYVLITFSYFSFSSEKTKLYCNV